MDEQKIAALLQVMQQAVQILQSGSGAGADPAADPNAMMDDGDADNLDPAMGDAADPNAMMDDPNADPNADPAMGGMEQPGLHDRVEQLENHTGLKKSATASLSLPDRVEQLESIHLKQVFGFDGDDAGSDEELAARLDQLEAHPPLQKALAKAATVEAPEQIDLSAVIEAAVNRGRESVLAELRKSPTTQDGLPDLGQMRTAATRRSQSIADLNKSADDDDAAVDFGSTPFTSALSVMYELGRGGDARMMFSSVADENDDD